jgi:hypothetical protein
MNLRMVHLLAAITGLLTAQPKALAQVVPAARMHAATETTAAQPLVVSSASDPRRDLHGSDRATEITFLRIGRVRPLCIHECRVRWRNSAGV